MWKIKNNFVVNPGIEFKRDSDSRIGITSRISKYKSELREQSFMVKGPQLFNKLSKNLREFPNKNPDNPKLAVGAFKKSLDKYLSDIPDQPNLSGEYTRRMTGMKANGERTNSILRCNNTQLTPPESTSLSSMRGLRGGC